MSSCFSKVTLVFLLPLLLSACGVEPHTTTLKEAWNDANRPEIIAGTEALTRFEDLPLKGEVSDKGWSDTYWPTYLGGISYRWQAYESYYLPVPSDMEGQTFKLLSPAEKYDIWLGRYDFPTVADERRRTRILKTISGLDDFDRDYKIPTWEGLCHGWAPAAHNFKEPSKAVTVSVDGNNKVVFYPSDIKALLIYYQQYHGNRSTRTVFAGERCNEDFAKVEERYQKGEITLAERNRLRETTACRDTNPATLHLALSNEIGRSKRGFIIDITRDAEVWNQPVNSYESKVLETTQGASRGAAPGTVKEVRIATDVTYTMETRPSLEALGAHETHAQYEYVLELDPSGRIIGGRWVSEERPDFLWRESKPVFQGYFKRLEQLYRMSLTL